MKGEFRVVKVSVKRGDGKLEEVDPVLWREAEPGQVKFKPEEFVLENGDRVAVLYEYTW